MRSATHGLAARPAGFWWLALAAASLTIALTHPSSLRDVVLRDLLVVIDVTGSMNVRDYRMAGRPASRLDVTKSEISRLLQRLPCGSRAGLAMFTERRSFPLFAPADVCENFAGIRGAIDALDWRMGWDGDSRVSAGLQSGIRLASALKADLVFLTDGHEAPPLPYAGRRKLKGEPGIGGVVVGVGGTKPSPIPKYDEEGREIGFYSVNDMVHGSRVGMAPPTATTAQGFHPRNNPYGEDDLRGTEHLSAVRTDYLQQIAAEAGLAYAALDRGPALEQAVAEASHARIAETSVPLDRIFAWIALIALIAAHLGRPRPFRHSRPAKAASAASVPAGTPKGSGHRAAMPPSSRP